MNKITILNLDDILDYEDDWINIRDGNIGIASVYPSAKESRKNKIFHAAIEHSEESKLANIASWCVTLATNNAGEVRSEPWVIYPRRTDAGTLMGPIFAEKIYSSYAYNYYRLSSDYKIRTDTIDDKYRNDVLLRPVLIYDEPDSMLSIAISKMIKCPKTYVGPSKKELNIIEYGYYPQNLLDGYEYLPSDIEKLAKYKTGNKYTLSEKRIKGMGVFDEKDEYYIKGKRCILIPVYYDDNRKEYIKYEPYMESEITQDRIVYHAYEVAKIKWVIDTETKTMVALSSLVSGFPIGYGDSVPETVYTFLNDVFGREILQTFVPPEYKQMIDEYQEKLDDLKERLVMIYENLGKMKQTPPTQPEFEAAIDEVQKILKRNGQKPKTLVKK